MGTNFSIKSFHSLGSKYADQWTKKKQFIQIGSQTLEIANVIGYNMTVTN